MSAQPDDEREYDDLRDYFDRYRMSYPLGSAERERGGQVIELIDDVEKAERTLDKYRAEVERLRKHARALEGVLRVLNRARVEIDATLAELGIGGQGDG